MSSAQAMKQHIAKVDQIALAPLRRITAAMPKDFRGYAYAEWRKRKVEVESEVEAKLTAYGAHVAIGAGGAAFTLGGIRARSTMGLQSAIRNWRARAERRVEDAREWGVRP